MVRATITLEDEHVRYLEKFQASTPAGSRNEAIRDYITTTRVTLTRTISSASARHYETEIREQERTSRSVKTSVNSMNPSSRSAKPRSSASETKSASFSSSEPTRTRSYGPSRSTGSFRSTMMTMPTTV